MSKLKKSRGISYNRRNKLSCLMFVTPWLIGAAIFFVYPLIYSLRLSFGQIPNKATQEIVWAGLFNYRIAFFEDAKFFPILWDITVDILINTPLIVVFALFISTMLNKDISGRGFFRTVFFLPVVLGTGFVMEQLLSVNMNSDMVNIVRELLLPEEVVRVLPTAITKAIMEFLNRITLILWKSGVQIIIFLAALQSIPTSFYEAAKVDSATEWECFWFVSLPMLVPNILLCSVYTIIVGFLDTDNAMMDYIHEFSFQWSSFEYASAMSWIYFLLVIIVLAIIFAALSPFSKKLRETA